MANSIIENKDIFTKFLPLWGKATQEEKIDYFNKLKACLEVPLTKSLNFDQYITVWHKLEVLIEYFQNEKKSNEYTTIYDALVQKLGHIPDR